jgi:hypothetical protein
MGPLAFAWAAGVVLAGQQPMHALLQDAEAAHTAELWDRCQTTAQRALSSGELREADVARAWWLRGACLLAQDDHDLAARCFQVAAVVDPTHRADDEPPLWQLVRQEVKDQALGVTITVEVIPGIDLPDEVVVTINDPLGLASHITLVDSDARELLRAPVADRPDDADTTTQRFRQVPLLDASCQNLFCQRYEARLLDKYGNALREQDLGSRAPTASPPLAPGQAPGWMSYVGGAALGVGLIGTGVAFFGVSSAGQADPNAGVDATGPWLALLGATGALVIGGAALLAADQLF